MISVFTYETPADLVHTDCSAVCAWLEAGDEAAAAWLFEKYVPLVRHICSRSLPRPWIAEDAIADTMSRAFQSLPQFDLARSLSAWISTIASRVCTDKLRNFFRRPEVPVEEIDLSGIGVEASAGDEIHSERFAAARELVASLQPKARTLVELHYFEGLTAREVADRTGLTPANVAVRLMRARQALAVRATAIGIS